VTTRFTHPSDTVLLRLPLQPSPTTVCECHDRDGAPLVCLLDARCGQLVVVRVTCDALGNPLSAATAFTLDALAAAPLAATRTVPVTGRAMLDLLVLRPGGRLELFVGPEHMCACDFADANPPKSPGSTGGGSRVAASTPGSSAMDMALTPVAKSVAPASERDDMDMDITPLSTADAPQRVLAIPASAQQPTPATPPPQTIAPLRAADVVGLADACGTHVNVIMAGGLRYRCASLGGLNAQHSCLTQHLLHYPE
jgi:hypothetical protein